MKSWTCFGTTYGNNSSDCDHSDHCTNNRWDRPQFYLSDRSVTVDHVISRQVFLPFIASKSWKLSFILNFASKFAYDLTTPDFKLSRFASDVRQKFQAINKVVLTATTRCYSWSYCTQLWTLPPSTTGNRSYELTCRWSKKTKQK